MKFLIMILLALIALVSSRRHRSHRDAVESKCQAHHSKSSCAKDNDCQWPEDLNVSCHKKPAAAHATHRHSHNNSRR